MSLHNPMFQMSAKDKSKLEEFWSFCKKLYDPSKAKLQDKDLEKLREDFRVKTLNTERDMLLYQQFLETVPLAVPLQAWLEYQLASSKQGHEILNCFNRLIEKGIMLKHSYEGDNLDLGMQRFWGHEKIIEAIRCNTEWTTTEREKMVSYYVLFADYLSQVTFGYVPFAGDPDKIKTARRVLPFEVYQEFVAQLPDRDALIAALLYYGGVSVTEVLALKVSQVDFKMNSIHFDKEVIAYPWHVMNQLKTALQSKNENELVFASRTGDEVNRSRLFRNFKNASAKMSSPREISPAILIESKMQ